MSSNPEELIIRYRSFAFTVVFASTVKQTPSDDDWLISNVIAMRKSFNESIDRMTIMFFFSVFRYNDGSGDESIREVLVGKYHGHLRLANDHR